MLGIINIIITIIMLLRYQIMSWERKHWVFKGLESRGRYRPHCGIKEDSLLEAHQEKAVSGKGTLHQPMHPASFKRNTWAGSVRSISPNCPSCLGFHQPDIHQTTRESTHQHGQKCSLWSETAWVQSLALPLGNGVTWDIFFIILYLHFSQIKIEHNNHSSNLPDKADMRVK